ncbi:hypothetical protein Tco_1158540, partial [Tanacetum coccineum]
MEDNPESILQDHAMVDSGCSSHMTSNKAYLLDYKDYNGGFVAFGSNPLLDESQVVLRAPRQNEVYSLDLKNIVPSGELILLRTSMDLRMDASCAGSFLISGL